MPDALDGHPVFIALHSFAEKAATIAKYDCRFAQHNELLLKAFFSLVLLFPYIAIGHAVSLRCAASHCTINPDLGANVCTFIAECVLDDPQVTRMTMAHTLSKGGTCHGGRNSISTMRTENNGRSANESAG